MRRPARQATGHMVSPTCKGKHAGKHIASLLMLNWCRRAQVLLSLNVEIPGHSRTASLLEAYHMSGSGMPSSPLRLRPGSFLILPGLQSWPKQILMASQPSFHSRLFPRMAQANTTFPPPCHAYISSSCQSPMKFTPRVCWGQQRAVATYDASMLRLLSSPIASLRHFIISTAVGAQMGRRAADAAVNTGTHDDMYHNISGYEIFGDHIYADILEKNSPTVAHW